MSKPFSLFVFCLRDGRSRRYGAYVEDNETPIVRVTSDAMSVDNLKCRNLRFYGTARDELLYTERSTRLTLWSLDFDANLLLCVWTVWFLSRFHSYIDIMAKSERDEVLDELVSLCCLVFLVQSSVAS